ncbi:MAG: hypothetical protein ABFC12_04965, partial [Methanobacterium sp.]
ALVAFFIYNPATPTTTVIPPGYGAVNNSQFQLETGWYQNFTTGYQKSAKLKFNGSTQPFIMIMVNQFPDESSYHQAYTGETEKIAWHVSSSGTETREGFSVKTIHVTRDDGSENVRSYFFEKNGKYYQVQIDTGSDTAQFFSSDKYRLDATVNTIIRTIN